jgi:hypothetical protein
MCVVLKHCGLKLKMLSPAPRLKKTAHWLKGGEGVKLKLLLKGTHKSTKNELFEDRRPNLCALARAGGDLAGNA